MDLTVGGLRAPTTSQDSTSPRQDHTNFEEIFDRSTFTAKSAVCEMTGGKNQMLCIDGRGKLRYFSRSRYEDIPKPSWLE